MAQSVYDMLSGLLTSAPGPGGINPPSVADILASAQFGGGMPQAPTDFAAGNMANERPATPGMPGAPPAPGGVLDALRRILSAAPAVAPMAPVRTDATGAVRQPPAVVPPGANFTNPLAASTATQYSGIDGMDARTTDFLAGNYANERPATPDMPGYVPPGAGAAAPAPRTPAGDYYADVGADRSAAITGGAGTEPAAAPAQAGPTVGTTLASILANALKGMAAVRPGMSKGAAAAAGAGGAITAGEQAQDRDLRRRLLEAQEGRAGRADTRAENADTRAQQTHELNMVKLKTEVTRLMGGQLSPEQQLKLDQVMATLYRSSRAGSIQADTPEQTIASAKKIRDFLVGTYRMPGTGGASAAPGTANAPAAPAPATGLPRITDPAEAIRRGAPRDAVIKMLQDAGQPVPPDLPMGPSQ